MMGLLGKVPAWLIKIMTGGLFEDLSDKLLEAYKKKTDAESDAERLAAETEIEFLKKRHEVMLEEMKYGKTWWIRPMFALPCAIYIWKIMLWDKALGLGTTAPLDDKMFWVFASVVGFYFVSRPFEKILRR